jgi:chromosome segregation ATPase
MQEETLAKKRSSFIQQENGEVDDLTKQLDEQKRETQKVLSSKKKAEVNATSLKKHLEDAEKQATKMIHKLGDEMNSITKDKNKYQALFKKWKANATHLADTLDKETKEAQHNLAKRTQALMDTRWELKQAQETDAKKIHDIEKHLNTTGAKVHNQTHEISHLQIERRRQDDYVHTLKMQLETANDKKQNVTSALQVMKKRFKEHEAQSAEEAKKIKMLKKALRDQNDQYNDLQDRLAREAHKANVTLVKEVAAHKKDVSDLHRWTHQLQGELKNETSQVHEKSKQVQKLLEKRYELSQLVNKTRKQLGMLNATADKRKAFMLQENSEIDSLTQELEQQKNTTASLTRAKNKALNKIQMMETKMKQQKQSDTQTEDNMKDHIQDLKKQNAKTTDELKHSQALIVESRKANVAVKKALLQKTRELQAAQDKDQKDLQEGAARQAALDQKIHAAQAQNKKLNMDLKKSQESLHAF